MDGVNSIIGYGIPNTASKTDFDPDTDTDSDALV
jgi:hypothetical protein